ncbi:hypothetical protein [Curtobacterium sp. MCBD17_021]|uniref:hypothetical protein n=1 Tax=Curtobacterium sp. MCBD17_021 TaxID=2175665 RepID=UPI0015E895A4|nr:hypothetical protein [Curtobacterium sp. MCBD17_021]
MTRTEKIRDSYSVNLLPFDWQAVVAVAVSVLGLVATFYTAFGSTARRLRSDLTTDVQLVAELEGDVKDDLQKSVTDRSYRLVAATRYPSVTWYEAALALLLVPLFWLLFSAPGNLHALAEKDEVEPILLGPGQGIILMIVFVTYDALVRSWSGRAAARVVYVYRRLGDDEARALVRLLAFPANLVPIVFFFALASGILLNVMELTEFASWPSGAAVLITTVISGGLIWSLIRIGSREDLFKYLRFYTDVLYAGADIPRLRPVELGQTEEELARYQAAYDRRFPGRRRTTE